MRAATTGSGTGRGGAGRAGGGRAGTVGTAIRAALLAGLAAQAAGAAPAGTAWDSVVLQTGGGAEAEAVSGADDAAGAPDATEIAAAPPDGAAPDGPALSDIQRGIVERLALNACRLAPDEAGRVFGASGLDPEAVRRTLAAWYVDGTATQDSRGTLHLPAAICPPVGGVEVASLADDALLQAFRDGGCAIEEGVLLAAFPDLAEAELAARVQPLIDGGAVTLAGDVATLADCN